MGPSAVWRAAAPIVMRAAPLLTSAAVRTTGEQFDRPQMLVPHVGGHRYGTVDGPPRFGVGLGYIVGYSCEGEYRGRPFQSRGYMEYVDCEAIDRERPGFPAG